MPTRRALFHPDLLRDHACCVLFCGQPFFANGNAGGAQGRANMDGADLACDLLAAGMSIGNEVLNSGHHAYFERGIVSLTFFSCWWP